MGPDWREPALFNPAPGHFHVKMGGAGIKDQDRALSPLSDPLGFSWPAIKGRGGMLSYILQGQSLNITHFLSSAYTVSASFSSRGQFTGERGLELKPGFALAYGIILLNPAHHPQEKLQATSINCQV